MCTEFFRTLKEAKQFTPVCVWKEVYGLDKAGTKREFKRYQDDAISWGRAEATNARAVVVFVR